MTLGLAAEVVAAGVLVTLSLLDRVSVTGILSVAFAFGVVRAVSTPAQRAMSAGRLSIIAFQTRRASS